MLKVIITFLLFTTVLMANSYVLYISSNTQEKYAKENLIKINDYLSTSNYKHYKPIIQKEKNLYLVKVRDIKTKEDSLNLLSFIKQYYSDAFYKQAKVTKEIKNTDTITTNNNSKQLLKRAITFYKNKNYKEAYKDFNILFTEDSSNIKINFYLGRSATQLQKYEEAYAAFDRILIQDHQHHRARLELARVLFLLKSYANAKIEFEKVLQSPIPKQVRDNVQKYINTINKSNKGYFINGALMLGFGWDNNINNNTYIGQTSYGNIMLDNDTDKKTDTHHKEILNISLIAPFTFDSRFVSENNFLYYTQNQTDYDENNVEMFSLNSSLLFIQNRYKISLALNINKISYGGESLMKNYSITPKINYTIEDNIFLDASLKYQKKDMTQKIDKDKDSSTLALDASINKIINSNEKILLSLKYYKERKKQGERLDVSKDTYGTALKYSKQLFGTFNATFSYEYNINSYLESSNNMDKRKEKSHILNIATTYKFNKTLSINTSFTKSFINSNIETYTYDKDVVSLMLIKSF